MDFRKILVLPLIASGLCAGEKLIPEFKELPKQEVMSKNPVISRAKDGTLLVNGQPKMLTGVEIPGYLALDLRPLKETPDSLRWLYDRPLDYESSQRLGHDALAIFNLTRCFQKMDPKFQDGTLNEKNEKLWNTVVSSGLPFYMDYTCFPWRMGLLAKKGFRHLVPEEALISGKGNHHWIHFNLNHPAARKMFLAYWLDGARQMKAGKVPVVAHELFNEPAFDDPSACNRKLFSSFLRNKYGSVKKMNETYSSSFRSFEDASGTEHFNTNPGLFVDWGKFMEKSFTDICILGQNEMRKIDPSINCSVQLLGYGAWRTIPRTNVNILELTKHLGAVTVPTGGGVARYGLSDIPDEILKTPDSTAGEGLAQRAFYRTISYGKTVIDSELTPGNTRERIPSQILLDLLRGTDIAYSFLWSKRGWEAVKTPVENRKERFAGCLLSMEATPPEAVKGFMDAKKQTLLLNEFFATRERHSKPRVALLFSFPTERYAGAVANLFRNDITRYAAALTFSHYAYDVIPEEYLASLGKNYDVIIAPGIRNVYPETTGILSSLVKSGKTLVIAGDVMRLDEYGKDLGKSALLDLKTKELSGGGFSTLRTNLKQDSRFPGKLHARLRFETDRPAHWQILATVSGKPFLMKRSCGKGELLFWNGEMQETHTAALLAQILNEKNIRPEAVILRPENGNLMPGVELHDSRIVNGRFVIVLFNHDKLPKLVSVRLENDQGLSAQDLLNRETLPHDEKGFYALIPASTHTIIGLSKAGFGKYPPVTLKKLQERRDRKIAAIREEMEKQKRDSFAYPFRTADTKFIDLREHANLGFKDPVANDGKGGMFDMGPEQSLDYLAWGTQTFAGVPFDIIRYDQNGDRTCIVLDAKSAKIHSMPKAVRGIRVQAKLENLYFLHTAAYANNSDTAVIYQINYVDGSSVRIPVVCRKDIWDWYFPKAKLFHPRLAWMNQAKRALYVMKWENPAPEKEIATLDMIGTDQQPVPALLAVTGETYHPMQKIVWNIRNSFAFGKLKLKYGNDFLEAIPEEKARAKNGGINFRLPGFAAMKISEEKYRKGYFVFKIRAGNDAFGNKSTIPKLFFSLVMRGGNGKTIRSTKRPNIVKYLENAKEITHEWTRVRIPLQDLAWTTFPKEINTGCFFFYEQDLRCGFLLKDLHFEFPE